MPVRKFRDVREMDSEPWRAPEDPLLWRAIAGVWDFAERTCPRRYPPGVYKHRSIEEAEQLREQWEETNFLAFQLARRKQERPPSRST
jgi:hypothetical protein